VSKYVRIWRCRPCGVEASATVSHAMPDEVVRHLNALEAAFRRRHNKEGCKVEDGDGAKGW
jgi:hypothetical protein